MLTGYEKSVLHHLSQYVTEHKKQSIERVLSSRTRYVTIVLEDIYQSQNSSAVIRTCECLGIQDVHIIENESKYSANRRVLKGADKWMTINRYRGKGIDQTEVCFQSLRSRGYCIAIADPAEDGISIEELGIERPLAIVLGNELHGLSSSAITQGDVKVRIPMYGFTESFNVSVSAALCLNFVLTKLKNKELNTTLSDDEKDQLRLAWFRKIIRRSEIIEREFLRTIA